MFLLNPGRYLIADPEMALAAATSKKLWASATKFGCHLLETPKGRIFALPTGKPGEFATTIGKSIPTGSSYIAFLPYAAAEKLLATTVLRLNIEKPTMLFFNAGADIVLDGKLTIFCH